MEQVETMMHFWRERLCHKLEAVNQCHPSRIPTTYTQVADHVLTTFEGAFILSKVMKEPKLASEQLVQCRNYIELLYKSEG
jgi:TetR/AcrR family transcriptional repressor of nem operon